MKSCFKTIRQDGEFVFFPQEDGQPLLPQYEGVFKKSNMGKSCVRLKNLDDKKIAAIRQLLQKI